jgi:gluconate 5-dehydrogenase
MPGSALKLFSLQGRVALVTGASRGLGRVMAEALAEAGATVGLAARDRARLDDAVAQIRAAGATAEVEAFDLVDEEAVVAAVPKIAKRHGRIDILLNNAAIMPRRSLLKSTLDDWDNAMRVNLRSAYLLCREAARGMIAQRYGRIINVSSYVANVGREAFQAYSASKAGLEGMTRSLACELGPHNITVNTISPGLFLTEMAADLVKYPGILKTYESVIALGRGAQPEEIAGAAVFFASDASSYVTGATLDIDGGVRNVMPMHYGG